jgi:uncharacterized protein
MDKSARRGAFALALAAGLCLAASVVRADTIWLPGVEGTLNVPTSSIAARKFKEIVRQQYDFSCGSAALATLLTFHYGHAIDERSPSRVSRCST